MGTSSIQFIGDWDFTENYPHLKWSFEMGTSTTNGDSMEMFYRFFTIKGKGTVTVKNSLLVRSELRSCEYLLYSTLNGGLRSYLEFPNHVLDKILGLNHTRCEFFFKQVPKAELPDHSKEKEHVLFAATPDDGVETMTIMRMRDMAYFPSASFIYRISHSITYPLLMFLFDSFTSC